MSDQTDPVDDLVQLLPALEPAPEQHDGEGRVGRLARLNVSSEAMRALPSDFVKRHRILPFQIRDGTLHVATADPGNHRVIDDIRLLSGLEVQESEAPSAEILEKIAECYQMTVEQMVENLSPAQEAANSES